MTAKRIAYNQDAREAIRRGVRQLARAVKVTLGPRGRNVLIEKSFGAPQVTKDGATVAKEVDLGDRNENIGAVMVREVAQKTADVAGDGTTTAVVLAEAIFEEGLKNVAAGASPLGIKRGIELAVETVVAQLEKDAIKILPSWAPGVSIWVLQIELEIEDEAAVLAALESALQASGRLPARSGARDSTRPDRSTEKRAPLA